jgi:hypothetical protein
LCAHEQEANVIRLAFQHWQNSLQGVLAGLITGMSGSAKCREGVCGRVEGGLSGKVCGRSDDAVVLIGEQIESVVVSLDGGALVSERLVGENTRRVLVEGAMCQVGVAGFCRSGCCVCLSDELR